MNPGIEKLYQIAGKEKRHIIGLMSGTSMDGLDIALCQISGSGTDTGFRLLDFDTVPYSPDWQERLAALGSPKMIASEKLCKTHAMLGREHGKMIYQFLQSRKTEPDAIDLIGSHGHSFYHAPANPLQQGDISSTMQIGEADHIATSTGIITVSDFRQKHIAAGGEGAPLAPYGDAILFGEKDKDVILLNIGGIANFSLIPAHNHPGKLIFGDTGPGNCLMDAWVRLHVPGAGFDVDAHWASSGTVSGRLLQKLLSHGFFNMPFPKSTGRETFHMDFVHAAIEESGEKALDWKDVLATLNTFTASSISASLKLIIRKEMSTVLYISGGGKHNPMLIEGIKKGLKDKNVLIRDTLDKGIPSDAKEAVIFALLANEAIAGDISRWAINFSPLLPTGMGKISLPG